MTENFKDKIPALNHIGIIQVCLEFYEVPDKRGFVHSPVTKDRTRSLKLYEKTNSFCDFANGNVGGDCIKFVSYVRSISNWEALQLLCEFYGLSDNRKPDKTRLQQQEAQRQREKAKKELKKKLWVAEVDRLKEQAGLYEKILDSQHIKPLSDIWCYCKNQEQLLKYRLDVLCGVCD